MDHGDESFSSVQNINSESQIKEESKSPDKKSKNFNLFDPQNV